MQSRRSVLVVDRDPNFRRNAGRFLRDRGFEVVDAAHPSLGLALVESEAPTFVLLDLDTTDPAGLEVLESMCASEMRPYVVGVSASAKIADVVEAVRLGALDVFERPVDGERLVALFEEAVEQMAGPRPTPIGIERPVDIDLELTTGAAMQAALAEAARLADAPILLIEGEPGAGHAVLARHAHLHGPRADGPLITVSADSPAGLEDHLFGSGEVTSAFAEAKGGTVYIEGISSLSVEGQERLAKLLQGLYSARVSGAEVRWPPMIGSIDRDLSTEVAAGRLREDIAKVFSRARARVPSLRERREDIPELIKRTVQGVQRAVGASGSAASPRAIETLVAKDWPGNIPQLVQTVKESCVLLDGGLVSLDLSARRTLPVESEESEVEVERSGWRPSLDMSGEVQPYDIYEAEIFRFALENAGGCVSRAAELLGVGRATMYRKMRAYNIDVPPVSERAIARSRGARQRRQEERAAAEARRRAFAEQNAAS